MEPLVQFLQSLGFDEALIALIVAGATYLVYLIRKRFKS